MRRTLEQSLANLTRKTDSLADDLRAGRLSLNAWRDEMRQVVKQVSLASHELAVGGREQMTQADYGAVGQKVRREYAYLDRWAAQLEAGLPVSGGRAKQYLLAGRTAYLKEESQQLERAGYDLVKSVLHVAESCAACITEASLGYIPVRQMILPGQRTCLSNCRCTLVYARSAA